ncbi:MAG: apolipoprotein N-acyltransferase [Candidatus Midichloriaceae bacterium]|jgi:apolipoprotein N-acyltransferase
MVKLLDSILKRCVVSFFLGIFLNFSFYPFDLFPFVICLGAFSYILRRYDKSSIHLFLQGFFFGYGYFLVQLYWIPLSIYRSLVDLEWAVPFLIALIPVIFSLLLGIFAIFTKVEKYNDVVHAVNFSFLWIIFEYLRSSVFFPFSWGLIGYITTSLPWISQSLSIFGAYGVGLFIVLFSTSIFTRNHMYIIANFVIILALAIWGEFRLEMPLDQDHAPLKVRIVQPNILQHHFGNVTKQKNNLENLINLTSKDGAEEINYIFWPEASFPYPVYKKYLFNEITTLLKKNTNNLEKYSLVFGADRFVIKNGIVSSYNSVVSINQDGKFLGHYDKRYLVPFGEYMPFQNLHSMFSRIIGYASEGSLLRGKEKNLIKLDDKVSFLPLICSESILDKNYFSVDEYSKYRFIANFTNDFWFGNSLGPYFHFNVSRVRAIEYGLPVLRIANNGISAVIDVFGNVIKKTKLNERTVIDINIPKKLHTSTIFYRIAHIIIPSIFLIYIFFICYIYIFRKILSNDTK